MPIRVTGLNSGFDTESLITELMSAYKIKTDKYVKAQTKLSWKQEAWASLNSKVKTFHSELSSLRFSGSYSLKTATISDNSKATVSASGNAINGVQSLQITQLAKAGYVTGAELDTIGGEKVSKLTKLSELKGEDGSLGFLGSGKIVVGADGKETTLNISSDSMIGDVIESLKSAGINASFDEKNQRMFISSKKTGKDADFYISGDDALGTDALYMLGISTTSTAATEAYTAMSKYAASAYDSSTGTMTSATTDASGKLQYNEDATKNYIKSVLNNAVAKKTQNENLTAENEKLSRQITYAGNIQKTRSVLGSNELNATETAQLQSLVSGNAYTDSDGNEYYLKADNSGNLTAINASGAAVAVTKEADGTIKSGDKVLSGMAADQVAEKKKTIESKLTALKSATDPAELDASKVAEFESALAGKYSYEANDTLSTEEKSAVATIQAKSNTDLESYVAGQRAAYNANATTISQNKGYLNDNKTIVPSDINSTTDIDELTGKVYEKVQKAVNNLNNASSSRVNTGARRVNGQNSIMYLNDAEFESDSNTLVVNGLTINATGVTNTVYDPDSDKALSITTNTNVDGVYDTIKGFLTSYNDIINEMSSLYDATLAKGYEPLTDDEKRAMSDSEIEKWESKVKSALLRRDSNLSTIMTAMKNPMSSSYTLANGKNYSLSSFGIMTLGYFNADSGKENSYHINGDPDDTATSSSTDKLRKAIEDDPDSVMEFMQKLTQKLYTSISDQMKASSLRSSQKIYNDKEMDKEYKSYTDKIKDWEKKVSSIEDSYYKKFAAMESAMAKLQSNTSSITGLLR